MCLFLRMSGMNAWRTGCGRGFRRLPWRLDLPTGEAQHVVYSVDNGPMAQSLMDTGQVTGCGKTVSNSVRRAAISPGWLRYG